MAKLAALGAALLLAAHVTTAFGTIITIHKATRAMPPADPAAQPGPLHELHEGGAAAAGRGIRRRALPEPYDERCNELRMIRDEKCRCEGAGDGDAEGDAAGEDEAPVDRADGAERSEAAQHVRDEAFPVPLRPSFLLKKACRELFAIKRISTLSCALYFLVCVFE